MQDDLIKELQELERLDLEEDDSEQRRIRRERRAQMKREKERYLLMMKVIPISIVAVILVIVGSVVLIKLNKAKQDRKDQQVIPPAMTEDSSFQNVDSELSMFMDEDPSSVNPDGEAAITDENGELNEAGANPEEPLQNTQPPISDGVYAANEAAEMAAIDGEVVSTAAIIVDTSKKEILSQRDAKARINPASMTKVLTVLVAAEHVSNLDDTFVMTRDITDYGYLNDCSSAGFLEDEKITIRDLFYGTILPSGADAAVGLATYVAGSQEAFVEMMNQKLAELGMSSSSHMTNCVGIFDDNHYSTVYDIAMIMQAAMDNPICREVLGTRVYTTSITEQHPEGITISNWFLRRIEDTDTHSEIIGAKTGFVVQSGNCAVSYASDSQGNGFICATAGSTSSWRCIYDHVAIYQQFIQ